MKLFENKILYIVVATLVSLSLVAYSYCFYSVQAAEVSTLPAAIDITVDYDSDTVNWVYDGRNYTFSRHYVNTYDIDGLVCTDNISSGLNLGLNVYHYSDSTVLPTVESFQGNPRGASYWFSPSENALYVLSTYSTFNGSASARAGRGVVRSYLVSGGHGCFVFYPNATTSNRGADFSCYRYDFNTNTMLAGSNSSSSSSSSASSFDFFVYYDSASGYTLSGTDTYKVNDTTQHQYYFPTDLLCLYSTYEISGFYQIDSSKVVTPDYYMQYQYIFYLDGKGYTFIDSGEPLAEVTAQGSYAYLTFADTCNKYVYTSVDGITWANLTTVSNIYGGTFTNLPYDWLYKDKTVGATNAYDAELVYTNDDKFGKPIITPEFGDLTDITSNLNKFLEDYNIISSTGRGGVLNTFDYYCVEFPRDNSFFGSFVGTLTMSYVNYAVYELSLNMEGDFPQYIHVYFFGRDVPSFVEPVIKNDDITGDFWLDALLNPPASSSSYYTLKTTTEIPTLSMYLRLLNNSTSNIDITLSAFRTDFHADLKSLFDNITLSNTYLSSISDKLGKLSMPDYSSALSDISAKLDKLPASGSSGIVFDDAAILGRFDIANDYLKDIKGLGTANLLTNILNLLTGTDGEGLKVTINPNFKLDIDNDLKAEFTAKIDKIFDKLFDIDATLDKIAEFNFGAGTDKDYSSQLTLINDNLYIASGRLYDVNLSLDKILQSIDNIYTTIPKNDLFYDDPDSDEDLIDFVSEYAKTALDKSYFASFLTFDDDTMSGIRFYNGLSEVAFSSLGPLGAVLLVPVGFLLVGTAVRRHT